MAETLAARPPTQPCDALALCMASWAASQKQQGDLMGTLATKLAPRLSEAVDSPRCAEVLSNTARAFAVEAARSDAPDAFQGLFAALEEACRAKRLSVDRRCGNQTSRRWRKGPRAGRRCYRGNVAPMA